MTETQFVILLGAVWLAPHMNQTYALISGALFTVLGCLRIWGLI